MFHLLSLHIHNHFRNLKSSPPLVGKGSHSSNPLPPKSPVKPGAQGITKLLLILWGVPHRNKKHWEEATPSPPGVAQGERGYLRGRKHKRDPAADLGQGECHRCWDLGALQDTRAWWDWLQAPRRRARGLDTKPQATWVPPSSRLPFSASAA